MSETAVKQQSTAAFYGQAVASFGIAMGATAVGIFQLHADAWVRGFLGIAVLYLVTSAFTLAKVIRDRQEAGQIVSRVDQAGWRSCSPSMTPSRSSDPEALIRKALSGHSKRPLTRGGRVGGHCRWKGRTGDEYGGGDGRWRGGAVG